MIKKPADPVFGEGPLPGLQMAVISLYRPMAEDRDRQKKSQREGGSGRGRSSFLLLFNMGSNPSMRTPPWWPNYLPKTPSPATVLLCYPDSGSATTAVYEEEYEHLSQTSFCLTPSFTGKSILHVSRIAIMYAKPLVHCLPHSRTHINIS